MKVVIKREQCVGHARCNAVAGELFPLDESGYIATSGFDVPAGQEKLAQRAARACPERIITIIDEPASGS